MPGYGVHVQQHGYTTPTCSVDRPRPSDPQTH